MTINPIDFVSFCYKLPRTYKANESRLATDVFALAKILEEIDKAIVKGQYHVQMYGHISVQIKVELTKMGYTVTILDTNVNPTLSRYLITWL